MTISQNDKKAVVPKLRRVPAVVISGVIGFNQALAEVSVDALADNLKDEATNRNVCLQTKTNRLWSTHLVTDELLEISRH